MNKQRKVVITTTYNEMGIIIDTKVEEVAQPNLQPTCNQLATDTISRAAAIDALDKCHCGGKDENGRPWIYKENAVEAIEMVEPSPSAEPKRGRWHYSDGKPARIGLSFGVVCDQCGTESLTRFYDNEVTARKLIDEQPTIQPEPHWIPVTERLPESKEEDLEYPTVLITFENEEIMLGCFYESTKEWGTGEYFDKKCNPIAWMPLPEPYKGVNT